MSFLRRLCAGCTCFLVMTAGLSTAWAKPKKKAPPHQSPQAALLATQSDGVQRCAIEGALGKGATRVEVRARVTINQAGQVVALDVNVAATGAPGEPVKSCVERLIRG